MKRPQLVLSVVSLLTLGTACQPDDEQLTDDVERSFYFEGVEVNAKLAEDPNAVFFVDLLDGATVYFDQREELIDYSNFIVQHPSMPAPVPMEWFARELGIEDRLAMDEWWMTPSASSGFRSLGSPGLPECDPGETCECDEDGRSNCLCVNGGGGSPSQ